MVSGNDSDVETRHSLPVKGRPGSEYPSALVYAEVLLFRGFEGISHFLVLVRVFVCGRNLGKTSGK